MKHSRRRLTYKNVRQRVDQGSFVWLRNWPTVQSLIGQCTRQFYPDKRKRGRRPANSSLSWAWWCPISRKRWRWKILCITCITCITCINCITCITCISQITFITCISCLKGIIIIILYQHKPELYSLWRLWVEQKKEHLYVRSPPHPHPQHLENHWHLSWSRPQVLLVIANPSTRTTRGDMSLSSGLKKPNTTKKLFLLQNKFSPCRADTSPCRAYLPCRADISNAEQIFPYVE